MKNLIILLIGLMSIFAVDMSFATEERIALVIGNGNYRIARLNNPVNDAVDIAEALNQLGFTVTLKTNIGQRTMEQSIRNFGKKLRSGGVGLFYFAGHGVQVKGRNYMIPIGAEIESESDVQYEAVDAGRILGQMEDAGNKMNIVILDACRNNPFAKSFRSNNRGLARMDAPTGSILAYATAPGMVSSDGGPGRNGLYTSKILKHINKRGLKVEDMFKLVRIDVMNESDKKQVPWESSSLTGHFYFSPEIGMTIAKQPTSKIQVSPELKKERELLERERLELERLKIEIEREKLELERKRLETEKKKKIASVSKSRIITRKGPIIKYENGILYDTETNLEWIAGPDKGTSWSDAKSWVQNLSLDGGGWRIPERHEAERLFEKGSSTIIKLLKITGRRVWVRKTTGSLSGWPWIFHRRYTYSYLRESFYRAFAVRSRK